MDIEKEPKAVGRLALRAHSPSESWKYEHPFGANLSLTLESGIGLRLKNLQ